MPNLLPAIIIFVTWALSLLVSTFPFLQQNSTTDIVTKYGTLAVIPPLFIFTFVTILGLISRPFQRGIVFGKFPREPFHIVYFCRRVFGTCWTQIFYFKPIYSVLLSIPLLKKYLFLLFGYKGKSLDFTVYPDTWIRDIPLLNIGKGAYLANRSTLGSNIILSDGSIYVEGITIGEKSLIGHLSVVGAGDILGDKVELGPVVTLGIRVTLEEGVSVKAKSGINHGTKVGQGTVIGAMSLIGAKAKIGPNLKFPAGSSIPVAAQIETQNDVNRYFNSEISNLKQFKDMTYKMVAQEVSDE